MPVDHAERAFEILKNEGPRSFSNSLIDFARKKYGDVNKYSIRRYKIKRNYIINKLNYDAVASPHKTITISSEMITKYLEEYPIEKSDFWGRILDGNWDQKTISIEKYPHYRAFVNHFEHDIPWEDTCIIDYKMEQHEHYSRDELVKKYEKYDEIYNDIRESKFKQIPNKSLFDPRGYNNPEMAINRNGEFLFLGNGHHRIAIAKILELNEIPVYVHGRHKQWQKVRDEIYNKGFSEDYDNELRDHPDLQDIFD